MFALAAFLGGLWVARRELSLFQHPTGYLARIYKLPKARWSHEKRVTGPMSVQDWLAPRMPIWDTWLPCLWLPEVESEKPILCCSTLLLHVNSNTGGIFPVTWLHIFLEGNSYQLNSPGSWTQTQPSKATSSSERKSSVVLGELVAEHHLCLQLSAVLEIPCPCHLKLLFIFVLSLPNLFMLSF